MVACPLHWSNYISRQKLAVEIQRSRQRKRDDLNGEFQDDAWEPPPSPPDDTLQIPGELVLGREGGEKGASAIHNVGHWPAKNLGYVPPSHQRQVPKYRVKWLDGTEVGINLTKKYKWTHSHPAFGCHQLGSEQAQCLTDASVE